MLLLLCVVAPQATLYFAPVGWNSHSVSPCPISWCRFGVRWRFKPRRLISRSFASFRSFDAAAAAVRIHHQQPAQWNATRCWGQQQQPGVVWTGKHRLLLQSLFHIWGKIIHHFTQHAMLYNWLYSSSSSDSLSNCVCTGKRVRKHPTILELQAGPPVISLFLFAQLSSPDYSSSFLYTQTRWQPFELCRFFPFFSSPPLNDDDEALVKKAQRFYRPTNIQTLCLCQSNGKSLFITDIIGTLNGGGGRQHNQHTKKKTNSIAANSRLFSVFFLREFFLNISLKQFLSIHFFPGRFLL